MTITARIRLDAAIRAVAPIHGTSGDPPDVRIDFDNATGPQQTNAQAVLAGFDFSQAADDAFEAEQAAKAVGSIRARRKTADQAFSTTAFADVADLEILLAPNTHYEFEAYGAYTAAAATTGLQLSVTGPASPVFIRFIGRILTSTTAIFAGAAAAYDGPIAATASGGATALPWDLRGSISTNAAGGLFKVRARSEINANAVNVLRGSILKVSAVN